MGIDATVEPVGATAFAIFVDITGAVFFFSWPITPSLS
jgi:hypothetical protein